ncbi:hypothetical protein AFK68_08620 [Hydrocoleum sp. CS-953]|uniref:hypothetical protein n=1 Tax=Hydrocoleum sp. CS-953 TaxID=1671698 RepID=UPI000B9A19ED|nr:hypothetical protein [Hydrocoleum sp. CS-953]OZH54801.1 hypothetical protein AFK68_08620 [Hydrocoleum sp. CS-953]
MLSRFINLNRIAFLANIITLITITCPSTATTFAFINIPETANLLLTPQAEEEEPGKTVPPN